MKKRKIILVGGGGHCRSCIDVIESQKIYSIEGVVDVKENIGKKILGYPVIGDDSLLGSIRKKIDLAIITVGQVKYPDLRIKIFNKLLKYNFILPVILSPRAYVSKHARLGDGTIVLHNAFINVGVEIGRNCIVNTNSVIEHDAKIGEHCHVSTGSVINGDCVVGNECLIGSCSVLREGIKVPSRTIVGAGSVVVKSLTKSGIYVGVPAKLL